MLWILLLVSAFFLSLVPVKLAAVIVRAKRTSFAWCFLATLVAGTLELLGIALPGPSTPVAVLLGGAGYSAILQTSYARGLAIIALQFLIGTAIFLGLCVVFGVMASVPRLGPVFS